MLKSGSSFQNGVTNVWRLHELYRNSEGEVPQSGQEYYLRIYVDGIGTTAGQKDTLLSGQGLGVGKTGVVERVLQAIDQVKRRIARFAEANPDVRIDAIEFDLFGFSRGAAAGRHAVNQLNRRQQGPLGSALATVQSLKPGFDWNRDVRVGFVGLFDTVVSTGGLGDGLDVRDADDRGVEVFLSPDCARKVVHLVARDEIRANFMLTTAKPHQEIELPGVHSDIGGSYRDDHEGPLWLTRPICTDEGPVALGDVADSPELRRNSMAYHAASRWLQLWQAKLGIDDPKQLGVDSWTWIRHQRERDHAAAQPHRLVYAAVKLDRPIRWEYQLIPLRLMHKLANEAGVGFKAIPDEPQLQLPVELEPIAAKLLAFQSLAESEEALLRRKYLHQSAHWNAEFLRKLGPTGTSADLVYVSRPDPSGQRTVRPNR